MERARIQGVAGTAQIFRISLLSQERVKPCFSSIFGKATDFKCGGYIYRANPNKAH